MTPLMAKSRWAAAAALVVLFLSLLLIGYQFVGAPTGSPPITPNRKLAQQIFEQVRDDPRFVDLEFEFPAHQEDRLRIIGEVPTNADAEALRSIVDGMHSDVDVEYEVHAPR